MNTQIFRKLKTNLVLVGFLPFFLALFSACGNSQAEEEVTSPPEKPSYPELSYLFAKEEAGYACFRIPAIVKTTSGSLIAIAEARKKGCSDTGDIDLVQKRSDDGGKTWTNLEVIWDDGDNTCGNPAPVVEESSGDIFLTSTWNLGSDHESKIISGESEDTRRVFVLRSKDNGKTWLKPRDITSTTKKENWTWYATGPGHGIQLKQGPHKGRLLIACDHIEKGSKKYFSHSIYSDDKGETWKLGGTTPMDQVNECTMAELSNGTLVINMRNYNREHKMRQVAFSKDGGITWTDQRMDSALIEPICQATLLSLPNGKLLFANPAHQEKRLNMTLKLSNDDGKTWTSSKVLYEGHSAYSDLVLLPNGNIGCLFEGGSKTAYDGITFMEVALNEFEPI